jgi:ABC-type phosphate/phosphonate transport system ATPase subunit
MSTVDARMHYFAMLTEKEQHQAIIRLANSGMADTSIAAATLLSVEQVRQILGARVVCEGCNDG